MYTHFEIDRMLDSMTVLVDTREQDTPALRARLNGLGSPFKRCKLDYGDYSAEITKPDGTVISAAKKIAVERKMSLDELCSCFTKERSRFEREFIRAKNDGARMHLLIENASIDKAMDHEYGSKMDPKSLTSSIDAWSERYDIKVGFCQRRHTGERIGSILRYGIKVLLERGEL